MLRLIRLEYLKLKHHKAMWILLALYILAIVGISFSAGYVLQYLADQGVEYRGIDPTVFPVYDFDDIWQNLAYLGYFFKIFPAFLLIISICNEYSYKTNRQNIIDGLSRKEFFLSKFSFATFLAILSGFLLLVIGLILGFMHSNVTDAGSVLANIEFVPVHSLQLLIYFLFAMLLAILIKRSGIAIVLFLMYTIVIEPIVVGIGHFYYPEVVAFAPLESIASLIHFPFQKYILFYTQDYVSLIDLARALGWGVVFTLLLSHFLRKRDF